VSHGSWICCSSIYADSNVAVLALVVTVVVVLIPDVRISNDIGDATDWGVRLSLLLLLLLRVLMLVLMLMMMLNIICSHRRLVVCW
jgi:hypothetical protein